MARELVVGEVLWDRYPGAARLGGAPLNFALQFQRLGHTPRLLRAVGVDAPGEEAMPVIRGLPAPPADFERFCRGRRRRCGWKAVAITLGTRGCAVLAGDDFVQAPGVPVALVDTVGAGDAFAAGFVHGLASGWTATAAFANRAGAAVAAVRGAIPAP